MKLFKILQHCTSEKKGIQAKDKENQFENSRKPATLLMVMVLFVLDRTRIARQQCMKTKMFMSYQSTHIHTYRAVNVTQSLKLFCRQYDCCTSCLDKKNLLSFSVVRSKMLMICTATCCLALISKRVGI